VRLIGGGLGGLAGGRVVGRRRRRRAAQVDEDRGWSVSMVPPWTPPSRTVGPPVATSSTVPPWAGLPPPGATPPGLVGVPASGLIARTAAVCAMIR